MKKYKQLFLLVLILVVTGLSAYSQTQPTGIRNIIASIDTFSSRIPAEKLYIHFDKPYYSTGDTIWLKAYVFDGTFLTASQKSGLVYLELANDTNKVLLRRMLPVTAGLGRGNIVLNKEDIPEGSYTIRAYTNLMRNFGEDYVFKKGFYVSGITSQSWLVSSNTKFSREAGKENLRMGLQFRDLEKKAIGLRELQVRVIEGKKVLFRDKVQTDVEGMLDVNFNLPEKADPNSISIVAEDITPLKAKKITIPVPVNRPENIDLQFMPEGGNLVNGVVGRVGFKAIGEDGKGIDVEGKVYGSSGNQEITVFSSTHKGMGSFYLLPQEGESYTAKIVLPDSTTKSFPIPPVKIAGTTLAIRNAKERDSLELVINVPQTITSSNYYLIGQHGSFICFAATVRSNAKIRIAKRLFPSGISHFTLLNEEKKLLNERIVYVDHDDNLNISLTTDKVSYKTRDSIRLNIEAKDKQGKPVAGSFSVAITDDSQVKSDSTNNIQTNMLLTTDLKGTVEDPNYYFQAANESWEALDNLLLTQGWVGYDWQKVLSIPLSAPKFEAEQEFTVKGKVTNVFNRELQGTQIVLFSTKPLFFIDTVTNKEGKFTFDRFPSIDSALFRLQASNKKGKQFNVGIEAEEFKPPAFEGSKRVTPWYVNSDSTLLNYVQSTITQREGELKLSGNAKLLNEVIITAKKIVKDSKNLNGEGNADITLDETDAKKADKMNLLQLIEKRIPSFTEKVMPVSLRRVFAVTGFEVKLIIDGMNIDFLYSPGSGGHPGKDDYFWYLKQYLEYFSAEDVKGVELMKFGQYSYKYITEFYSEGLPPYPQYAFLEVTTRSGNGLFMKHIPGTYLYKAMPFAGTKQFYSPKYTIKDKPVILPDLRSTIHWEPDVITDRNGKAVVSFYSADSPGTYSVIVEGSDMKGNVGTSHSIIYIKK